MSTPETATKPGAKAVALSLDFSKLGNSRKIDASEVTNAEVNTAFVTVTKRLFKCEEYDAIGHRDSRTKAWLGTRALPSLFKRGIYLVPNALVAEVNKRLHLITEERKALVEAFVKVYSAIIEESAIQLKGLFELDDYPTEHEVRSYFRMTWQYLTFDTPASLKAVSESMFQAEQEKAEAQWKLAMEEARKVLRASMAGLVGKIAESLQPDEFGSPKKFKDVALVKMRDFLGVFKARDITDDAQLGALVDKAKDLCRGLRAEDVNLDKRVREKLEKEFGVLTNELGKMVIAKPSRAISFDVEE